MVAVVAVVAILVLRNDNGGRGATTAVQTAGLGLVAVPDVVGRSYRAAVVTVAAAGLTVPELASREPPTQPVAAQRPAAGSRVPPHSKVALLFTVPDVIGQYRQQAILMLQVAGFGADVTSVVVTDPARDGLVQRQTPADGQLSPGSRVAITVGRFS